MRRTSNRSNSASARLLWLVLCAVLLGSISFVASSFAIESSATTVAADNFEVTGKAVAVSNMASTGGDFALAVEAVQPVAGARGGTFELYPESTSDSTAAGGCPCQSSDEIFSDGFE